MSAAQTLKAIADLRRTLATARTQAAALALTDPCNEFADIKSFLADAANLAEDKASDVRAADAIDMAPTFLTERNYTSALL